MMVHISYIDTSGVEYVSVMKDLSFLFKWKTKMLPINESMKENIL